MMPNASFKKEGLKIAFWGLILGVLILLTPFFVSANNFPFSENFNSYDTGLLHGQGGWTSAPTDRIYITEIDCLEGKCIEAIQDGSSSAYKSGDTISDDGEWSWFARTEISDNSSFGVDFYDSSGNYNVLKMFQIGTDLRLFGRQGGVNYDILLKASPPIETWYQITCQWKNLTDGNPQNREIRCKFNEESWTEWIETRSGTSTTGKDVKRFYARFSKNNDRFDFIGAGAPCMLGLCKNCGSYTTCVNAGCLWYQVAWPESLGIFRSHCIEPYEPDPEECGSFFKCQYCSTQELCEAELNCEWIDIGFGFKCYMIEPEVPAEQVEWEVPDLEDCEELSGVEKWLCEIKNFVAGIFMPSQEAFDKLFYTLGNFKQRFPFNYVGALFDFFTDVSDSLDEEKDIPIKILGEESNVSFAFWEETTTIGGEGETLKNVIFDFTSFIIFLGWLVWLMSFVKRFF